MFKAHRLNYARQCVKLMAPQYEKEHAYRLAHESVLRTNLHLLSSDSLLADCCALAISRNAASSSSSSSPANADSGSPEGSSERAATTPAQVQRFFLFFGLASLLRILRSTSANAKLYNQSCFSHSWSKLALALQHLKRICSCIRFVDAAGLLATRT